MLNYKIDNNSSRLNRGLTVIVYESFSFWGKVPKTFNFKRMFVKYNQNFPEISREHSYGVIDSFFSTKEQKYLVCTSKVEF